MSSSIAFLPTQRLTAYAEETPSPLIQSPPQRLVFSGSGSEYFRIWIVNMLLTLLTFGIYSAWAKVRKTRYFYDNTQLDGSSFEYHGQPMAILKGRIVAAVLLVAYNASSKVSPMVGLAIMACIGAVLPWLIWKSLQFKLHNSSYRGIRFGFRGSAAGAYLHYLCWPIAAVLSLSLLAPLAHQRMKRFQHSESRFGSTYFFFDAQPRQFYKAYMVAGLVAMGGVILIGIAFGGSLLSLMHTKGANPMLYASSVLLFMFALYCWTFTIYPLFLTMLQNLIWNHTQLGEHRFRCDMHWTKMTFIMVTNLIGIALTLGLYTPFAQVRAMKYRLESMTFVPAGDLDNFIASSESQSSATGEGMADLLGLDLSL